METIKKNIGLDAFRSHFPGLLPFIGDDSGKTFPVIDDENGNFGKIVLDLKNPFDAQNPLSQKFANIQESFTRKENGKSVSVFSYSEMSDRYFYLTEALRQSVILKKVYKISGSIMVVSDDLTYEEKRELTIYDPTFFRYYDINLMSKINPGEELPVDEDVIAEIDDTYVLVIPFSEEFNKKGGFEFIDLFEQVNGILPVPSDIQGISVPSFVSLYDVEEYYNWLLDTRNVKNSKVQSRREELGSDDMMFFLKKHLNDLTDLLALSESLILQSEFPDMLISLPLSKTGEEIGIESIVQDLTGEEQYSITTQFYKDHPGFDDLTKSPIKAYGESELLTLMSTKRDYSDPIDDEDPMLPGIFKKAQYSKEDILVVKRTGRRTDWEYETIPYDQWEKSDYEVLPTFAVLAQMEDTIKENKRYLIQYDNGVYYKKVQEPKKERYILRKKDNYEIYEVVDDEYYKVELIEYEGDKIPEGTLSENDVYHLKNNVFDGSILLFELDTYIRYNERDKVWRKYNLPSKDIYELSPDEYVKIRYPFDGPLKEETRFYSTYHHFENVQITDEGSTDFYKAEYVPAEIPFFEFDGKESSVYDKRYSPDGRLIGSYITQIYYYLNYVYFEYVISGEPFGDQKAGIFFNERYSMKFNQSKKITIDGYDIEYIYNEIDYKSKLSDFVKEEWGGLTRKTVQAEIEYNGHDFWNKSDFDIKPSIKNETYSGQLMMNDPEVNITFDRGNASAFERYFKLMECNTFEDLKNYGNDFFGLRNETPLK